MQWYVMLPYTRGACYSIISMYMYNIILYTRTSTYLTYNKYVYFFIIYNIYIFTKDYILVAPCCCNGSFYKVQRVLEGKISRGSRHT